MSVLIMIAIFTAVAQAADTEDGQIPPGSPVENPAKTKYNPVPAYLYAILLRASSWLGEAGNLVIMIVWANFIDRWFRRRHLHPPERGRKRNAIRVFIGMKAK